IVMGNAGAQDRPARSLVRRQRHGQPDDRGERRCLSRDCLLPVAGANQERHPRGGLHLAPEECVLRVRRRQSGSCTCLSVSGRTKTRLVCFAMLPELTPAAARAVEAAEIRARCQGAASICPDDLLYGLLQEEEGRAAVLMAGAGADVAAIRASLDIHRDSAEPGPTPPFGEFCQAIFALATELTVEKTAEHTVGSDALLVAVLRVDERLRRRLEAPGLNWEPFE